MLTPHQGITYNKFEKPNDWPKLDKTFDYKYNNGKLVSGNEHIYLSGPVTYEKVGSPTIKDNVASGFSASDYLRIYNFQDSGDSCELNFTFTTPSSDSNSCLFYANNFRAFFAYNGRRLDVVFNSGGSQETGYIDYTFDYGTKYTVNILRNGTTAFVKIYKGTTLEKEVEVSNISAFNNGNSTTMVMGYENIIFAAPFNGSIDLNETYIKVNGHLWFYGKNYTTSNMVPVPAGLEYNNTTTPSIGWVNTNTSSNFQQFTAAPEGVTIGKDEPEMLQVDGGKLVGPISYTKVGDPTIVDGIASGFSSSNYLQLQNSNDFIESSNTLEGLVDFTTSSTEIASGMALIGLSYWQCDFGVQINTAKGITFRIHYYVNGEGAYKELVTSSNLLTTNTNYKLLFSYVKSTGSMRLLLKEGNTVIANISDTLPSGFTTSTGSTYYQIGYNQRGAFDGSINLNNTYIKVNNQLWFGKEDWTPSTYTDNAIYLLGSHSTDYSNYNTLEFTPTVSDNSNYDVWIDNQKLFENENGGTSINWQNLGLATGYSITTPSTLKAHTIKIVPANSAKNIIGFNTKTNE